MLFRSLGNIKTFVFKFEDSFLCLIELIVKFQYQLHFKFHLFIFQLQNFCSVAFIISFLLISYLFCSGIVFQISLNRTFWSLIEFPQTATLNSLSDTWQNSISLNLHAGGLL